MIVSCQNISKSFIDQTILKNISFNINEHEKVAIVGVNGAGKSTLLKIIMNQLKPDDGDVIFAKDITIGYLAQNQRLDSNKTIYDEMLEVKKDIIDLENRIRTLEQDMKHAKGAQLENMLSTYSRLSNEFDLKNGYAYKSEVVGILKGLGFFEEDFNRQISTLSGGQVTRVALGKLLLANPDLIILDEPTNHLDMQSIAWLENFLYNSKASVIIVAHDRYFLDKVVSKVIELKNTTSTVYTGNYTNYAEKSAQIREIELKHYLNQQQEIKHQEEVIEKLRSFNREKSIKRAESREKMLNKIDRIEKPIVLDDKMHIKFVPSIESGNDVLTVSGLTKAFGNNKLFSDIDFSIKKGEKVAIIGNNGTGKTTILKILNNIINADSGKFTLGAKVNIGYYDQEHHVLHPEKTLFEEISDEHPAMTNTEIRNLLAGFLFTGDDVFKKIKSLSGGERGRLSLAKLMLSESNFLVLDEPTNHLDIVSKELLENALLGYTGTVLYVSHDRYFINKTATRILDLANETITNYIGNYDYYLEKHILQKQTLNIKEKETSATKLDWKENKKQQAEIRKKQAALQKIENKITELEERNAEIDLLLSDESIYSDVSKLLPLNNEKNQIEENLEILMQQWEDLSE